MTAMCVDSPPSKGCVQECMLMCPQGLRPRLYAPTFPPYYATVCKILYSSNSQTGVCGPFGVRETIFWDHEAHSKKNKSMLLKKNFCKK